MYPYILQGTNLTIVIDNETHTIGAEHIQHGRVMDALRRKDWAEIKQCIKPDALFINFDSSDSIKIENDTLTYKGKPMHSALAQRVVQMVRDGFDAEPMVAFMQNLMKNPSKRAVDELYGFLECNTLPITPDGHFLAYKKVRHDYKDIYTGTIDNSVGTVVEMERNEVCDDKERTCDSGLHFCSKGYLNHFGGHDKPVMILKINPADVVSIPVDYNNSKGRCCRYEVVGQLGVSGVSESVMETPVSDVSPTSEDSVTSPVESVMNEECCGVCGGCNDAGAEQRCEEVSCDHDHNCVDRGCHDGE